MKLLAAHCALLGLIAGALLGLSWGTRPESPPQPESLPDWERLSRSIELLAAEVRERASEPRLQAPAERQVVGATDAQAHLERMDRLIAALERDVEGSSAAPLAGSSSFTIHEADALALRGSEKGLLSELRTLQPQQVQMRHVGWTLQRLLRTYGPPDSLGPSMNGVGIVAIYHDPDGKPLMFWLVDGVLVSVGCPSRGLGRPAACVEGAGRGSDPTAGFPRKPAR